MGREPDTIVESLQKPFYNLALRMLLSPADAEDATQEALIKVVRNLHGFKKQSKFSTWAWSVASRTFLDFRRGQYRRQRISFEDFKSDLEMGLVDNAAERPEERALIAQVKVGCARALLQCLDGDHRLAYILGEILEVTTTEGAAIAGVNEAAYRKRLSRARERISKALRAQCGVVESTAQCRCHRRLERARALGRIDPRAPDPGVDVASLRALVGALENLSERAGLYYRPDPEVELPFALSDELRRLTSAL